jgi:tetratricopeptide (TPR) repeat protein
MRAALFVTGALALGCASPRPPPTATPAAATTTAPTEAPTAPSTTADAAVAATAESDAAVSGDALRSFREGMAAMEAGRFQDAARAFAAAFAQRPSFELAYNAGRMYERLGDVTEGARWFREALSRGGDANLQRDLRARLAALEDYGRRQREGVMQPPPGDDALATEARTWFQRGNTLFAQRRYADALRAFEAANQVAPGEVPELTFNLALTHERLGRRADAASAYREYLAARPDAPDRARIEATIRALSAR